MAKRSRQLGLFEVSSRDRRRNRGEGQRGQHGLAKHVARPVHQKRHPVHVTMRRVRLAPSFRSELVYAAVMFNFRKHAAAEYGVPALRTLLDGFSSAPWFEGWHPESRPPPELLARARRHSESGVTSEPATWLARTGWRRAGGAIRFDELPRRLH